MAFWNKFFSKKDKEDKLEISEPILPAFPEYSRLNNKRNAMLETYDALTKLRDDYYNIYPDKDNLPPLNIGNDSYSLLPDLGLCKEVNGIGISVTIEKHEIVSEGKTVVIINGVITVTDDDGEDYHGTWHLDEESYLINNTPPGFYPSIISHHVSKMIRDIPACQALVEDLKKL